MNNIQRLIYGLLLTVLVFAVATFFGGKWVCHSFFFPQSFATHTLMLILSAGLILSMRKQVHYKCFLPRFKDILKPILLGLVTAVVVNVSIVLLTEALGEKNETQTVLTSMTPLQVFFFVFVYASIAEELLFRGFLMNMLKPLNTIGFRFFGKRISLPVLVSAFVFGLAHLILITTGASVFLVIRIIVFTISLGLLAGYYQEKYDNHFFAIIVHMSGNLLAMVGSLLIY